MNDEKNPVYFCIRIGGGLTVGQRYRGFNCLLQENNGRGNNIVSDGGDRDFLVKIADMKEEDVADWMTSTGNDLSKLYDDLFYIGYGSTIDAAQDDLNRILGS
jgi:hypothetical protein